MKEFVKLSNELMNMKKAMDKIVESFFSTPKAESSTYESSFTPPVNAVENNDEIKLYVLIPFAKKEDISLNIEDGVLIIEGKTSFDVGENEELIRDEIPQGAFSRKFKIASNIDSSKVKASYKDGILTVLLPKKEEAKTSRIAIE